MTSSTIAAILLIAVNNINFSMSDLPQHITISVGNNNFTIDLINAHYTWFEALDYCTVSGYTGLDAMLPNYFRTKTISQFLRESVPSSTTTLWLGHFRYTNTTDWYTYQCENVNFNGYMSSYQSDEQCAVLYFTNTSSMDGPEFQARNCLTHLPFMCLIYGPRKELVYYNGYRVRALLMDSNIKSLNMTDCENYLMLYGNCQVILYNHGTGECTRYCIVNGYGKVNEELYFTGENITTVIKNGMYSMTSITNVGEVNYDVSETFPGCGVESEIITDKNCCPCNFSSEMFRDVPVQPEIPVKSTGRFKRTLVCANDERKSSKVIGAFGVLVIGTVLSLVILADFLTLFMKKYPNKVKPLYHDH